MKTIGTSVLILLLIVSMMAGCIRIDCWGGANETSERTEGLVYEAAPPGNFHTETINGSITIHGEEIDQIRVQAAITGRAETDQEARRIAQETKLEWKEADSDTLTLLIVKPNIPKPGSVSVSLDISLPRQTALNLKSTNGSVVVSRIDKDVIARTTNGRIELVSIGGSVEAGSTNGKIRADQVAGNITCHTTNGKIDCSGLFGNLSASATNGSVETGYDPSAPADRNISIHTTNGSVNVNLPSAFAGKTEASTSNGKIICDRLVTVSGRIDKHLNGTIGQGTGRLALKTTNGSIHIR